MGATGTLDDLDKLQGHLCALRIALERSYIRDYFTHLPYPSREFDTAWQARNTVFSLQQWTLSLDAKIEDAKKKGIDNSQDQNPVNIFKNAASLFDNAAALVQRNGFYALKDVNRTLIPVAELISRFPFPSYFQPSPRIYAVDSYRFRPSAANRLVTAHFYIPDLELGRSAAVRHQGRSLKVTEFTGSRLTFEMPPDAGNESSLFDFELEIPTTDFWSFLRSTSETLRGSVYVEREQPFTFSPRQFGPFTNFWRGVDPRDPDTAHAIRRCLPDGRNLEARKFPGAGGEKYSMTIGMGRGDERRVELIPNWSLLEIESQYADGMESRTHTAQLSPEGRSFIGAGWSANVDNNVLSLKVFPLE